MGIKQYKPTSAGRRAGMVSDFADCTNPNENKPEKSLLVPRKKKGGRNNQGIITSRFRGGGHKQMYRVIDFKRNTRRRRGHGDLRSSTTRTAPARIALIAVRGRDEDEDVHPRAGRPEGRRQGDLRRAEAVEPKPGNCMPLWKIPLGHDRPQRRDEPGQRRPDLPLGRVQRRR